MERKLLYFGAFLLLLAVVALGLHYAPLENLSEIGTKDISDPFADSGDLKVYLVAEHEYQVEIRAHPALDNSNYQVYVEHDAKEYTIFERQGVWTENATFRFEAPESGSYQVKWNKLRVSRIVASEIIPAIPPLSLLVIGAILLLAGLASIIMDLMW